ncbi:AFR071Wp [Eremothecium gossypii ATCC 10895]|uniref:Phospholipase n=1 Tax=Eremothecium gossypii (strain ATCC 10895 / CBS 109.51 / FGSC 9923 / NRRL Y-1056) TaxID=284811 RepID=Q754K1_EREGS|nr:AFR071Wp [Eremothecium gossypii ATCC 10895]AAS53442.2 AFR071Wp [Eremothecium gossypii ATCC 10895]
MGSDDGESAHSVQYFGSATQLAGERPTQKASVIPGIYAEAEELGGEGGGEDVGEAEHECPLLGARGEEVEDQEAEYKNLVFQGVPNSTITTMERGFTRRGSAGKRRSGSVGENTPTWLAKMNPQDSFTGWKKEFGQAFKKISKLTSRRSASRGAGRAKTDHESVASAGITEEEMIIQNMASDLIATLLAGCPGALFAGSGFLRDEHGVRRAPLLLAMLSVRVSPVTNSDTLLSLQRVSSATTSTTNASSVSHVEKQDGGIAIVDQGYHTKYKLELEYGVGDNRLKWIILRSYKDLASLHGKLKLVSFQQNTLNKLYIDHNRYQRIHLPHFPRFDDYMKKAKKGPASVPSPQDHPRTSESSSNTPRSSLNFEAKRFHMKHIQDLIDETDDVKKPMHKRIEKYLRLLNLSLSLRPQANRLFQFYELSPISNLLSYESGFQGKQGYLIIRSSAKAQGWRVSHFRFNDWRAMIERHTNKWFLVRHSYIMYVSDMCSTTPLDVFLVDSKFKVTCSGNFLEDNNLYEEDPLEDKQKKISTKLLITLENSERKLQMIAKSEYMLKIWVSSIIQMQKNTIWANHQRFGSFAPVRRNCFCHFLVDGRDYFWALSEALTMARDVIFIHDWWLSPELYMRRPVQSNQQYRIDRVLKERAEAGVKIFIVVYRNVGSTVGTDSLWTKHSMLSLHPNIHLIRSPNQWLQNTYFWAHHEKMCVIDHTIAFMGGIDLCYGRYDSPEHVLRDDASDLQQQNFPGKDYSNARICDFHDLDKPFESMYDREVIPRMPWHDVHMMTVGEAARDMSRHFVQRWNYLLRQKRPSRPTPLLTPPSDFTPEELENSEFFRNLNSRSTCEVQILRSAGNWSLGLQETEKSIQAAYLKLIETSKHYIYLENQFFVTASNWDGVFIENKVGDAIVDRIIKANSEGKLWKAFILIPLMPGFDSEVDQPEGSSIRVIMQCQYQSIARGETSIFAKLRRLNIDPLQYIQFYSLRKWSTLGQYDKLVTEQLYVHAKVMIVDDRSCIIGSANVNERSMLGNRDSEVAAIIRDTELVKSKMNGEDYYAGRFALELRQRLMREHLGCDVDLVEIIERKFSRLEHVALANVETLNLLSREGAAHSNKELKIQSAMLEIGFREVMNEQCSDMWLEKYGSGQVKNFGIEVDHNIYMDSDNVPEQFLYNNSNHKKTPLPSKKGRQHGRRRYNSKPKYHSFNNRAGEANVGIRDKKPISTDSRLVGNETHMKDVEGLGPDGWKNVTRKFKENVTQQLMDWATEVMNIQSIDGKKENQNNTNISFLPDKEDVMQYLQDSGIPDINKWNMLKRICYLQHLSYKKETKLTEHKKLSKDTADTIQRTLDFLGEEEMDDDAVDIMLAQMVPPIGGENKQPFANLHFMDPYAFEDPIVDSFYEDMWFAVALRNTLIYRMVFHCQPDNSVQTWRDYKDFQKLSQGFDELQRKMIEMEYGEKVTILDDISENMSNISLEKGTKIKSVPPDIADSLSMDADLPPHHQQAVKTGAVRAPTHTKMKLSSSLLYGINQKIFDRHTARRLLERINGHLVIFPTDWLAKEVESKNWFYNADRLPPIDIYD